ncbi:hypothetical protein AC249_AIPGENE27936 [Exaiptasia diaphana]|nr:hypothetical protein AC249_AIPGENE27936 [Exaiptasia diaphana]
MPLVQNKVQSHCLGSLCVQTSLSGVSIPLTLAVKTLGSRLKNGGFGGVIKGLGTLRRELLNGDPTKVGLRFMPMRGFQGTSTPCCQGLVKKYKTGRVSLSSDINTVGVRKRREKQA